MASKRVPTSKATPGAEERRSRAKQQSAAQDPDSTHEERWRRTAIAAYYRAEARGFAPGGELEDWLAAEREVDADPGSEPTAAHRLAAGRKGADALDSAKVPAGKTARERTRPTRGAAMDARKQGDRS